MTEPLFRSLDSAAIAEHIRAAQHPVCHAASRIQSEPAKAMVEVASRIKWPGVITLCLEFDERVMREGFGDLAAVKTLRDAGIVCRTGLAGPAGRAGGMAEAPAAAAWWTGARQIRAAD
jgi:hypothetical protein